jgi:hypothetical protein
MEPVINPEQLYVVIDATWLSLKDVVSWGRRNTTDAQASSTHDVQKVNV